MHYQNQFFKESAGFAIAISGSLLLGIPASMACTPISQADTSVTPAQSSETPLPEQQTSPVARVMPVNGRVQIKLTNETGDPVTYQVIGDTRPRVISGESEVTLLDLEAPLTVTFQRPNGGLLRVQTRTNAEPGVLEVTLTETTNLGTDKNALMVEETGLVFLN